MVDDKKTKRKAKPRAKRAAMVMPDLSEFAQQGGPPSVGGPSVGRVEGLDYEAWAAAVVDLGASEHRIENERTRLHAKGYRPVDGSPLVGGFPQAEVWVIPRAKYRQNRAARLARMVQAVENGTMTEFALGRGTVLKSR